MINHENDSISSYPTKGDMMIVHNASEIGSVPLYSLVYKGENLERLNNKTCSEFDGDCLLFAQKHFHIYFEQFVAFSNGTINSTKHTIRECS